MTEQLIKLSFTGSLPNPVRKLVEPFLAVGMTLRRSKHEIMLAYLSHASFATGTVGLQAAADRCWGKRIENLSANDAALLAVALPAPRRFACGRGKGVSESGRAVLKDLVRQRVITPVGRRRVKRSPLRTSRAVSSRSPIAWCTDWVRSADHRDATSGTNALTITCDTRLETAAQEVLAFELKKLPSYTKGGVVVMRPDGAILALIGGGQTPPEGGGFNNAVSARRAPNSTIKIVDLLVLLKAGRTLDAPVLDSPLPCDGYTPVDYDRRYLGSMRLRDAFRLSRNAPFVIELCRLRFFAWPRAMKQLGLPAPEPVLPSHLIGTGEITLLDLTAAVAAIVRSSGTVTPYALVSKRPSTGGHDPIPEAGAVCEAMRGVVESGTARMANADPLTVAKTGSGERDATIVGSSGDLVLGVWLGVDGSRHFTTMGGEAPARIFKRLVQKAKMLGLVHPHRCGSEYNPSPDRM